MKVVLIHDRLKQEGGLETRFLNYINEFHQRGDEITIITAEQDKELPVPEDVRVIKVRIPALPKTLRRLFFNFRLKRIMKKLEADFSLSIWRTSHQQVVLSPGNKIGHLEAMDKKGRNINDWIKNYLDHKSYENSELILAASKMIKRELIHYYQLIPEKIKVLYPPINTDVFNSSIKQYQTKYRKQFNLAADKKYFLFLSTSNKRKGWPLLLNVFSHLTDSSFHLLVAGPKQVNVAVPNVTNLGYVKDTNELLGAVDFLIHPARYEPYGQVVIEAIQCGTPVIVSNMTGAAELIDPKVGIVVNDFKESSWVKAIHSAVEKSFLMEGDFANKHNLTIQHHIDKMLEFAKEFDLISDETANPEKQEQNPLNTHR